ncbi:MAG: 50S ribosomal protein L27 [Candidatus Levybacteria bacterium]|nr:50S ribosomal protein L27 [Candidatus Levybacteria bacterium]
MAHTKAQGSVKGNRDSRPKRRGVKVYGGSKVSPGGIIIRQVGSRVNPGPGVLMGRDFTLFAIEEGTVKFKTLRGKKYVEVING